MNLWRQCGAYFLSCSLVLSTAGCAQDQPLPEPYDAQTEMAGEPVYEVDQSSGQPPSPVTQQTPEQLQQLAAPIALYPDALVAQVLTASTYPTEVVEADRWLQQHADLKGPSLAQAVDPQPWDPSIKALTQFPAVLANMDKNLSWTSSLGDAYVNQPQDVLNAVQIMRQRAQQAGNLQSNAQQTVTTQGQTITVQPANPDVVYVPAYDPWLVYGSPVFAYPGWTAVPGVFVADPGIYFGAGFGVGFFGGWGWGWPFWGCDWFGRRVIFHNNIYISHSRTFIHHGFGHRGPGHGGFNHVGGQHGGFDHGPGRGHFDHGPGSHASTFSGFDHGGRAWGNSSRGHSSFGGGAHVGGVHAGGGGGFHGGGGGGFHGGGGGGHR